MNTTTNKNRHRGKTFEKHIAKLTGGDRVGIFGGTDVVCESNGISGEKWSIECKTRKSFTGKSFMDQSVRNSPFEYTPLVIVHVVGQRHDNDLVMIRMKDWRKVCNDNVFKYEEDQDASKL